MTGWHVLDGREVRAVDSYEDYFAWLDSTRPEDGPRATRQIATDQVGEVFVSTVFLGLDHNYSGGPPIVFETMAFDHTGKLNGQSADRLWRYATLDAAEAGHAAIVAALREGREMPDEF